MNTTSLLAGIGVGAAATLLLDPAYGRRRRSAALDQAAHAARKGGRVLRGAVRDAGNRLSGLAARAGRVKPPRGEADDDLLTVRVRTAIGRAVSHSGAVHVMVEDDIVRLDGAVLSGEVDRLLSAVRQVEGVIAIDNRLRVSREADSVPELQGTGTPPARRRAAVWNSPMMRLGMVASGVAGLAAIGWGAARTGRGDSPLSMCWQPDVSPAED